MFLDQIKLVLLETNIDRNKIIDAPRPQIPMTIEELEVLKSSWMNEFYFPDMIPKIQNQVPSLNVDRKCE